MPRNQIREFRRIGAFRNGNKRLFGDVFLDLRVALEFLADSANQRFNSGFVASGFFQIARRRLEEWFRAQEVVDRHACLTFDKHFHRAIRQLQKLQHIRQNARAVDAINARIINAGIDLRRQENLLVIRHHFFQRAHRFLAPYKERHDHVREHDDVAQRQHWIGWVQRFFHALFLSAASLRAPIIGNSASSVLRLCIWGIPSPVSTGSRQPVDHIAGSGP